MRLASIDIFPSRTLSPMRYLRLRRPTCGDPSVMRWSSLRLWQLLLLLPLVIIGTAEVSAQPTPADFERFKPGSMRRSELSPTSRD